MDENKVETKSSNNSAGLIVVMVIIGIVAVAGFVFMSGKKTDVVAVPSVTDVVENTNQDALEKTENESEVNEAVNTADDLVMEKEDGLVVINVTGENFKFMPETITVKVGSKVKINFESTVGFHNFVVDEFNVATEQVNTGGTTTVEFIADKIGSFEYYCSVAQHRANGMVGKFIVTE